MSTTALILIIVVIVIVVLLLALFFASRRRAAQRSEEQRERTREAFGSEYERMAQERGSEEETERGLAAMYPEVADDYREAWRIRADVAVRSAGHAEEDSNEECTEELRQAIRKYRAVYQRLVQE